MISDALSLIADHLNEYLKHKYVFSENLVVLGRTPVGGTLGSETSLNKIVVSAVGIELPVNLNKPSSPALMPEMNINITVIFAANFSVDRYSDSLNYLEDIMAYLYSSPVFNSMNSPGLPESIDRISCEIIHLPIQEQSHLWLSLGSSYMPSLLYRLRIQSIATSN